MFKSILSRYTQLITEKLRYKASPFMDKKRSESGAFRRMGWRGFRSLRDATRTPYPIDQDSGRKAEHSVGWDGEETSPYPIDQEKKKIPFSKSSSLSEEVIINC